MQSHRGREFWIKQIEAQNGSDLSIPKFCESNKLVLSTFRAWRYRLKRELRTKPEPKGLVEVKVKNIPHALPLFENPAFFEVLLPNGRIVRWPLKAPPAYLADATNALENFLC